MGGMVTEPRMIDAALALARRGFRVVPLHVPVDGACSCDNPTCRGSAGKHPRINGWQDRATNNEQAVAIWWQKWPSANVGIAMGGSGRLVAIDVDGEVGRATLAHYEKRNDSLPPTLTARSGREDGGEHRIFRVPDDLDLDAIPNGVGNKRSRHPGIDIRSDGGQIVAPPSLHYTGRRYAWIDASAEIADLPTWLHELVTRPEKEQQPQVPRSPADVPYVERVKRASAYLAKIPGAIEGQQGGTATFVAAMKVGPGFCLDEHTTLEIMREFNARCVPPWEPKDLERKVREAFQKGAFTWGDLLRAEPERPRKPEPFRQRPPVSPPIDPPDAGGGDDGDAYDDRPVIELTTELDENILAACNVLRRDPNMYQRDGQLVHVIRVAEADGASEVRLQAVGTPQIRPMATATLAGRLTRCARFVKFDARAEELKPKIPPQNLVMAVSAAGEWPGVRPLTGLIETPTMRPDGSLVSDPGYDAPTGYVLMPSAEFLDVPEAPSQADANAALAELCEVWCDFPWASDAARYVPIAALLTLLARPAIAGSCPAFVFDASTPGSGKTLCADAVAAIALGREAARMTWPPDEVELEKVLGAYALRGAALISFDNITSTFGGGPLDRVLTATDKVELRVLGKSEVPSLRWRSVIMASGNNIALGPDTTRRVLVARMEPNVERPEDRTSFKHPRLIEWVSQERPRLVRAALTILRAYVGSGRPEMSVAPWGSFEAWRALIASAIVFAGGPDVSGCRSRGEGEHDPDTAALRTILLQWPMLSSQGISAKGAVDVLYPVDRLRGNAPPDGFNSLREAIEAMVHTMPGKPPSPNRLGHKLRHFRGRIVGSRRLNNRFDRNHTAIWLVEQSDGNGGFAPPRYPQQPANAHLQGLGAGDAGDEGLFYTPRGEFAESDN